MATPPAASSRPKRRSSVASTSKKPNGKSIYAEVPELSSDAAQPGGEDEEIDQLASSQVNTPAPAPVSTSSPNKLVKKNKRKKQEKAAAAAASAAGAASGGGEVKKESGQSEADKEWFRKLLADKQAALLEKLASTTAPSTPAQPTTSTSTSTSTKKKKKDVTSVGNENKSENVGQEPKSTVKKSKAKKKVTLVEVSCLFDLSATFSLLTSRLQIL